MPHDTWDIPLAKEQRDEITIHELAKLVFRLAKENEFIGDLPSTLSNKF